MNKPHFVLCSLLLLCLFSATALGETINGFVTDVKGKNQLSVGEIQVVLTAQTRCEIGAVYSIDVTTGFNVSMPMAIYLLRPHLHFVHDSMETSRVSCTTLHVAIGSRVRIVGQNASARVFSANTLVVYQIKNAQTLTGTALLEEAQ